MYTSPPQVEVVDDDVDVDVEEDGDYDEGDEDGDDGEDDGDNDDYVYHVCDMMASSYLHVSNYLLVVDNTYR